MGNPANSVSRYDFEVLEQFGRPVEISSENQFTEYLRLANSKVVIQRWREYCQRRNHPYVVAVGRLKPIWIEQYEQKEAQRRKLAESSGKKYKKRPLVYPKEICAIFRDSDDWQSMKNSTNAFLDDDQYLRHLLSVYNDCTLSEKLDHIEWRMMVRWEKDYKKRLKIDKVENRCAFNAEIAPMMNQVWQTMGLNSWQIAERRAILENMPNVAPGVRGVPADDEQDEAI